jgi:hypothetical protein
MTWPWLEPGGKPATNCLSYVTAKAYELNKFNSLPNLFLP